jgi:hypothetical protein
MPWTMTRLLKLLEVIKNSARIFWVTGEQNTEEIDLTKVDVKVEMNGSFIPRSSNSSHIAAQRAVT